MHGRISKFLSFCLVRCDFPEEGLRGGIVIGESPARGQSLHQKTDGICLPAAYTDPNLQIRFYSLDICGIFEQ